MKISKIEKFKMKNLVIMNWKTYLKLSFWKKIFRIQIKNCFEKEWVYTAFKNYRKNMYMFQIEKKIVKKYEKLYMLRNIEKAKKYFWEEQINKLFSFKDYPEDYLETTQKIVNLMKIKNENKRFKFNI
jgi:hypothetical protein